MSRTYFIVIIILTRQTLLTLVLFLLHASVWNLPKDRLLQCTKYRNNLLTSRVKTTKLCTNFHNNKLINNNNYGRRYIRFCKNKLIHSSMNPQLYKTTGWVHQQPYYAKNANVIMPRIIKTHININSES